eukprot:a201936_50.p1 GENE.a201936_50~~a201936_50.p1  ORF type:complete len:177 (-),score=49.39 a201936_50:5-466(-)
MGSVHDNETRVILRRLAILLVSFYALYYIVSTIVLFSLRVPYRATLPFDHVVFGVKSRPALASFLAMISTYVASVVLMLKIVKSSSNAWDYVVTVSFLHWILTCLVTTRFPTNWVWWLTFLAFTAALTVASEIVNFVFHDLRQSAKIADAINA